MELVGAGIEELKKLAARKGPPVTLIFAGLETQLRAEGHAQVVVGAVYKVNVVAYFGADANRTSESFESSARIDCERRFASGKADGIYETCGCILVADAEVIESDLAGHEDTEWAGASLEFWPEKPVEGAEPRVDQHGRHDIGEGIGVVALEVVSHLGFDLNAGSDVKRCSASHTDEVADGRRVAEAEIICERADFDVIAVLLRHEHRRRSEE